MLLTAVRDNDPPFTVSLHAACVKGLALLALPFVPVPMKLVNNLLSEQVKKYPPGSFKLDKPE